MSIRVPLYARDGTVRAWSIIDDEDAHLAAYRWRLSHNGYACRTLQGNGRQPTVFLHRDVLGLVHGDVLEADHIDGDRLNNRRSNLRVVTHAQNQQNLPSRGGTSQSRGVFWYEPARKWRAKVQVNGRMFYLGRFADEDEAGRVASECRLQIMPFTNEDRMVAA
jgi:hypothetical protein